MNRSMEIALFSLALFSLFFCSCSAQTCKSYTFSNNALYSSCNDLPVLNSFLHWNYESSTRKLDLSFRHTGVSKSNWVAWAINPTGTGMVGSQALVAYQHSNGSMRAYTSPITEYRTSMAEGKLSFSVLNLSALYANNEMIIFATIELPSGMTTVNQVWQDGPVSSDSPTIHATSGDNIKSVGSVNFLSGEASSGGGGSQARLHRKNAHGILSAISWGTLLPIGAMIARYMKVFKSADPAWFYLHVACQSSAYIIGVSGWALGLKLGSDSSGVQYDGHRTIGIVLFSLGTLQMFALLLRPKKDHKLRLYWNIYHMSIGYGVIILSIINIFKGFDILDPEKKWKRAYIGILIFLGAVTVVLEAFTWLVVLKRKKTESSDKYHQGGANVSVTNGHLI